MKLSLLLSLTFLVLHGICFAQPLPGPPTLPAAKPPEPLLFIGQPVTDAQAVLKALDITASDLPFPFPAGEQTHSFLGFTLNGPTIHAQAFYDHATRRLTSLAILISADEEDKSSEAWISAQSIRFNPDRTFDIRFAPPLEPRYETKPIVANPAVAEKVPEALIYVGQDVAAATAILKSKKIEYASQVREIMKLPDHLDDLNFGIDTQHCYAYLVYSKTTKKLESLGVTFFPAQKQSWKTNQTNLQILAVRFNPDGSYELRFKAPLTPAERAEWERQQVRPQNVYPTRENTPPRPQSFGPGR